jgi:hypothetical protein
MMFTAYRLSCGSSKSTGAALRAALPLHSDSFHRAPDESFLRRTHT